MGYVIALIVIVCVVYLIVLIGTVAYQLTGLDWDTAQFQALSAFTNTGFTTRAAELVVRHPARRRITMTLIATGYAAAASVIATLVGSMSVTSSLETALNLAVLVLSLVLIASLTRRLGLPLLLATRIRRLLMLRMSQEQVPHEELLQYKQGFAISRIEIPVGSKMAGKSLRDADLRSHRLQVLAIERGAEILAVPDPDWVLAPGDHLVLYGEMTRVQGAFAPARGSDLPPPSQLPDAPPPSSAEHVDPH